MTERYDFYRTVHRGLRHAHGQVLTRLGATDPGDPAARAETLAALDRHLEMCATHLADEDSEIHPALEQRRPGAAAEADDEHEAHEAAFVELRALAEQARGGGRAVWDRLYRRFALLVAKDLIHMDGEETRLMPALQEAFSDDELHAIEGRIVARIPPEVMVRFLRAMLAAIPEPERRAMLDGMAAGMPGPAFANLMEAVLRAPWDGRDYGAFARAA